MNKKNCSNLEKKKNDPKNVFIGQKANETKTNTFKV